MIWHTCDTHLLEVDTGAVPAEQDPAGHIRTGELQVTLDERLQSAHVLGGLYRQQVVHDVHVAQGLWVDSKVYIAQSLSSYI